MDEYTYRSAWRRGHQAHDRGTSIERLWAVEGEIREPLLDGWQDAAGGVPLHEPPRRLLGGAG